MRILVLGRGKTGSLVATIAAERGHSVRVLDEAQNHNAMALTPPLLAGFEVIIDFTTPDAAVQNMRACLATGAKMVVGTTGWYSQLDDMCAIAARRSGAWLRRARTRHARRHELASHGGLDTPRRPPRRGGRARAALSCRRLAPS